MRTLTVKEIVKIAKEFPFLHQIIDLESAADDPKRLVLKVQVSVADGETLYTKPRFCLDPNWIGTDDNKYVGHLTPIAYVINQDDFAFRHLEWGYENSDSFLKELVRDGSGVKVVVLIMKYKWWHNIEDWFEKGLETYVGEYSHREYEIYIFKQPNQGMSKLIEESNLAKNVRITDLLSVSMAGHRQQNEASVAVKELTDLVDRFERTIGAELWQVVNECVESGMSGVFGKTELRTFTTAGRIMLSFWRGPEQITFVGDESDYTRTGLQSMNCTVDTAKRLVQDVIDNWQKVKLQPNENISII